MPRRRSTTSSRRTPLVLVALAALALILFAGGEFFSFMASDAGHLFLARHLHVGERAVLVRIIGRHVREGLRASRVADTAVIEEFPAGGRTVRWRVDLPREESPLKVNYAVARAVESVGAVVVSGRERAGEDGELVVTLEIGLPGRITHVLVLTRAGRPPGAQASESPGSLAVVLFGLGEDEASRALLAREEPLAVAAGAHEGGAPDVLRRARERGHETVLQIPMEPENYPRVNPGPGTLLVSMSARRIGSETRAALGRAPGVVAVSNFMGSFATQDEPFMTALFEALRNAQVPYLQVSPPPRAVGRALAAHLGVAYDECDLLLDSETRAPDTRALDHAWHAALERSRGGGRVIVWLRATPLSARWLPGALAPARLNGVRVTRLSQVVHRAPGL